MSEFDIWFPQRATLINTITLDSVKVNIAFVGKHRALRHRDQRGSLGSLEGMKDDNIKPEKIFSSSPFGHSAQNDVYLLPKELVE